MKMLQPASMRNLKFSTVTALINCRVGFLAGVDILAAGLVHSRQSATRMFWVLRRNIVIRVNVMMIQLERDLKIICHAILELFAKIEDIVDAVLFFPVRGHPLLKFPTGLWEANRWCKSRRRLLRRRGQWKDKMKLPRLM
jgi:hypothetical protein